MAANQRRNRVVTVRIHPGRLDRRRHREDLLSPGDSLCSLEAPDPVTFNGIEEGKDVSPKLAAIALDLKRPIVPYAKG